MRWIAVFIGIPLACSILAAQNESKPDLVLTGLITRSDYHTYRSRHSHLQAMAADTGSIRVDIRSLQGKLFW